MTSKLSFERICCTNAKGYVYDEKQVLQPNSPDNYDEVVFKLITKIDTNLLLLESHKGKLKSFTLDVIPLDPPDECDRSSWSLNLWSKSNKSAVNSNIDIINRAWKLMENDCDGLITIAVFGPNSLPDNECREKYTLAQFVDHVLSSVESYYMFHKPRINFNPQQLKDNVTPIQEDSRSYEKGFAIIIVWNAIETHDVTPSSRFSSSILKADSTPKYSYSSKPITSSIQKNIGNQIPILKSPIQQELLEDEDEEEEEEPEPIIEIKKKEKSANLSRTGSKRQSQLESDKRPVKKTRGRPVSRATSVKVPEEYEISEESDDASNITVPASSRLSTSILQLECSPKKSNISDNNSEFIQKKVVNKNLLLKSPIQQELMDVEEPVVDVRKNEKTKIIARSGSKRQSQFNNDEKPAKKSRGRPSRATAAKVAEEEKVAAVEISEDEEVTFKPQQTLNATYTEALNNNKDSSELKESTRLNSTLPSEEFAFGFDKKTTKRGTKSMGRKSIVPDWPEDQKLAVLDIFDNLNPKITETTQIALTCKYASIQFDRELSSKLLYSWVQKKGRDINRTINGFNLHESQVKSSAIDFYHTLNTDISESGRVAFIIKYFKAQFDISLSSKDLLSWLSGKNQKR